MNFTYVIEHMEEDEETPKAIPPWVELEYTHMRMMAGPDALVQFTHLSQSSSVFLNSAFAENAGRSLSKFSCHQAGVLELMEQSKISLDKVCLLDPKAEKELSPEDGDGRFEWFLFGGILGDDPPRDRTSELRNLGFPTRHLGSIQMTTDTALGVTKLVIHDRIPLNEVPYIDHPTIRFNSKESVEMPFRYIADGKEPRLPPGMKKLLHEDLNKTFDF
ncbi:SAM-dependent RNA methyltransferase [Crassisporium funariophilum]|nr:SAM-dependent RNA methyltransferase [Crassisporium funariophilum]